MYSVARPHFKEKPRMFAQFASTLALAYPEHRYFIAMTKGGVPLDSRSGVIGTFPTDAGCAAEMLNSPWLECHMAEGRALIFAFEHRRDLGFVLSRIGTFAKRGYAIVDPRARA
jgi:hypothetical protein